MSENSPVSDFIMAIIHAAQRERAHQIVKYGSKKRSLTQWAIIIESELEEVKRAYCKTEDDIEVKKEMLQVFTCVLAALLDNGFVERDDYAKEKDVTTRVVVSGSFRRGVEQLHRLMDWLRETKGYKIIAPVSLNFVDELEGCVRTTDQQSMDVGAIERKYLAHISEADELWLHLPDGYAGISTALEIGYAHRLGLKIFSRQQPRESVLRDLVTVVGEG